MALNKSLNNAECMSRADFAKHIGVTRGRVTQMISAGMIGPDAIVGEGRSARVIVAKAIEQIARKRDIGQALGNGLMTRLDAGGAVPDENGATAADAKTTTVDDELKQQRLEGERRRNRLAAEDEAARRGRLVETSQVRAEMTKLAKALDDENAGMLADFAAAIAAEFHMPQRDVLHLLRRIRDEKKAAAAERARRRASSLPEFVATIIEDASS